MKTTQKKLVILEVKKGFFSKLKEQAEFAGKQGLNGWGWKEQDGTLVKCCLTSGYLKQTISIDDPILAESKESEIASMSFSPTELQTLEEMLCEQRKKVRMDVPSVEIENLPPLKIFSQRGLEIRIITDRSFEPEH
jgi:hypothetical protein